MKRCARFGLVITSLLLLTPASSRAHDVAVTSVGRVFIDQIDARRYVLSVVDSGLPPIEDSPGVLPPGCHRLVDNAADRSLALGVVFDCDEELTFDAVIVLPWNLAGVVAVARWNDGTDASAYFIGEDHTVPVRFADLRAGTRSAIHLASRYVVLGAEHILLGIDHLLFVLGLLLLVRGVRPLVKTITAFTIAHSLTLAAAVMDVVPVQTGPVETTIALSIVLLAREIVVGDAHGMHLVHRRPWLVAFVFGLLHGLGFAGALGEIGLRSADIPIALLFFNVGVEVGQLLFVGALLCLNVAMRANRRDRCLKLRLALGYALGSLAMLWFFDRLPSVWQA